MQGEAWELRAKNLTIQFVYLDTGIPMPGPPLCTSISNSPVLGKRELAGFLPHNQGSLNNTTIGPCKWRFVRDPKRWDWLRQGGADSQGFLFPWGKSWHSRPWAVTGCYKKPRSCQDVGPGRPCTTKRMLPSKPGCLKVEGNWQADKREAA